MKNWREKFALVGSCILSGSFILSFPMVSYSADINSLQQQKDQLNQQLNSAQTAAQNKANEAKTLSTQINNLDSGIKSTEQKIQSTADQITQTQTKIDTLSKNVDAKKAQLDGLKKQLNGLVVEIYRYSSRSELENLLLNDKLSQSANEKDYVAAVQMQVKVVFSQVDSVKADLEKQKSDQEAQKAQLDQLNKQQEDSQSSAKYQVDQKNKLLDMTVEQKAAYDQQIKKIQGEYERVDQQMKQMYQQNVQGSFNSQSSSLGYPWAGYVQDSIGDPYGFLVRECTSYVAWRWNNNGWTWLRNDGSWPDGTCGGGNAKNWACAARAKGMSVGSSPTPGAIAVWTIGSYGHVAYVDSVSGGNMTISDYNAVPAYEGQGNTRTISIMNSNFGSAQYIYPPR